KPGNVGLHAGGHGMTAEDFRRSADAAASPLCAQGAPLGRRILAAIEATRGAVGQNTNLGIILLAAPLAMAAERGEGDLRAALVRVLHQADLADAEAVFRAIVLASPGGLGEAPRHDVREPATVTLAVAMAAAAERDRIAWQWTHGFADVFGPGLATYAAARARWADPRWAALAAYLRFLASIPDSHVARKFGLAEAERIRAEATPMQARLRAETDPERLLPELLAWDAALKRRGINPGTSADLTVATIFAHNLLRTLRAAGNDG
ncbi:MAG: triphosphoribosyl-dephospho-CoA synthase, partial [Alphaproteobacteria bacterium]|nr:triphosphoribosyl-dephospho-CoA synthase [Alphaproteobacteria bacterium]